MKAMLKAARGGSDDIVDALDEVRRALDDDATLLDALPDGLLHELAAALLDQNDVATATAVLQRSVGPAAARMRAALAPSVLDVRLLKISSKLE